MAAERRLSKSKKRSLSTSKEPANDFIRPHEDWRSDRLQGRSDYNPMKKVLAERSQKTQSFQWPVSAVWSTFYSLVEIIDATTMRNPQDWLRSSQSAWLITCGLFSPNDPF